MYQHVCNVSIRKRGERETHRKIVEDLMAKNFPNLAENINLYQDTQKTPSRMNIKLSTHRYTIAKMLKPHPRENLESSKRK